MKNPAARVLTGIVMACAALGAQADGERGEQRGRGADAESMRSLSAQWWQWVGSIPNAISPVQDDSGARCGLGQRGNTWFLAGTFGNQVTRKCTLPASVSLFFPVVNSAMFASPDVCGDPAYRRSVRELRELAAPFIDTTVNLLVELDGKPLRHLQRVRSEVFELTLPAGNIYDAGCIAAGLGGVPAGVYSPAVDDGYYVRLAPLSVGAHSIRIQARNPDAGFNLLVQYQLDVVQVYDK